ncbi:hypothetical protein ZIOFF_017666 [Zingiber officinale]|uniref:BTB/POZ domain-containing protein n=1 Tax=Zingiber officinale TaxID=94328 RepID=A0A8J5HP07_ZINOF|nr:hypothetical protein ZIOFF_017666 [Zingiber officinale]
MAKNRNKRGKNKNDLNKDGAMSIDVSTDAVTDAPQRLYSCIVSEFTSLMLDISNMSEEDKLYNFLYGLQPWAQIELRRQNVRDLPGAFIAADALANFHSNKESLETSSPPKVMKNRKAKEVERKKDAASSRRNGGKDHSVAQGNNNLKSQGCFLCNGPHLVQECPKREKLNVLLAVENEECHEEEVAALVNPLHLLNSIVGFDANKNEGNVEVGHEGLARCSLIQPIGHVRRAHAKGGAFGRRGAVQAQVWQEADLANIQGAMPSSRLAVRGALSKPKSAGGGLGKPACVAWAKVMPRSRLAVRGALSKTKFAGGGLSSEAGVACMLDMPSGQWSSSMGLSKAQALVEQGLAMIRAWLCTSHVDVADTVARGVLPKPKSCMWQTWHCGEQGMCAGHAEAAKADRRDLGTCSWRQGSEQTGLVRGAKEIEPWAEHLVCKHALARGQRDGAVGRALDVQTCFGAGPKKRSHGETRTGGLFVVRIDELPVVPKVDRWTIRGAEDLEPLCEHWADRWTVRGCQQSQDHKRNMLTLGVDPMQHYDGASTWVQAATWHGANGSQRHLDMAVLKIKKAGRVTRSKNLRKLKRVAKAITKNEKAWTTAATAGTESSSSTLANQETMASMTIGSKPETFQLEGQTWKCLNELSSDVVIEVGEMTFYLHKFPLLNRSGLLRKAISEFRGGGGGSEGKDSSCILQLHDIPGGAKAFELVAKFCYDVRIELNALNVVSLRCAAEHLCMGLRRNPHLPDREISRPDLRQLEGLHQGARGLRERPPPSRGPSDRLQMHQLPRLQSLRGFNRLRMSGGRKEPGRGRPGVERDRPGEDIQLGVDLRLVAKGMKPESIAGALMFYAKRFLPGLSRNLSFRAVSAQGEPVSAPSESDQRVFIEEIVDLLPMRKGVTTSTFLLNMLRTAMILRASASCRENLERRIGSQLDEATLEDILIPNLGYSVETLYDIDCVQRILDHFMQIDQSPAVASSGVVDEAQLVPGASSPALTPLTAVAKLVDGYLAEVSTDVNLKPPKFMALTAAVPDYGRPLDDGIYRAVDIYLKSHPWLTEAEKEQLCRLMNCQKLSLEACTHAAQNERLPLRVIVQVLFFEQLRLRTSVASWFFVSDNLENPPNAARVTQASLLLQKTTSRATRAEVVDAQRRESERNVDVRQRIIDLEKECLGMKKEIEKLGKPKAAAWSIFARMKPKPRKEANC